MKIFIIVLWFLFINCLLIPIAGLQEGNILYSIAFIFSVIQSFVGFWVICDTIWNKVLEKWEKDDV